MQAQQPGRLDEAQAPDSAAPPEQG
jgi:hypothetical protein